MLTKISPCATWRPLNQNFRAESLSYLFLPRPHGNPFPRRTPSPSKIGDSPAIPEAQPKTTRPSAITGTSTAPARPVSSGGKHSGDALWTLLGSFAEKNGAAPDDISAQKSPSRSRRGVGSGKPRGSSGGVTTFAESGAGAKETAAAIAVNPLVVSVVTTLRAGSGSYLESKGVLEVGRKMQAHFFASSWINNTRSMHAVSADSGRNGINVSLVGPSLANGSGISMRFRFLTAVEWVMRAVQRTHIYILEGMLRICRDGGGREGGSMAQFCHETIPNELPLGAGVQYFKRTCFSSSRDTSVVRTPERSRRFLRLPLSFTALSPDQAFPSRSLRGKFFPRVRLQP